MLSLQALYAYEGVVVGRDSADPLLFHCFPNDPRLALDDQGRPAIRLLVYKEDLNDIGPDEEHATGFLVMDTHLGWPEETLKRVARKVKADFRLDEDPRLTPLLYRNGTVRLTYLDRTTQSPGSGTPAGGAGSGSASDGDGEWVIDLESSNTPSLYGSNRAIFSAVLTKKATQLTMEALDGFVPAGVTYDLGFVGLQRAFRVHAKADWSQVYSFIRESWKANFVFFFSDVENIVSKLEEKKLITFEASLEGIGEEGMEGEFNAVRKIVQDFVLERFFKPEPLPNQIDAQNTGSDVLHFIADLRDVTRPLNVGYSRLELDDTTIRSIDIDFEFARAVERRIAPQAHLSVFLADHGLTRDDVVEVVDGRDEMWREVAMRVSTTADFAAGDVAAINVQVAYGGMTAAGEPATDAEVWSFVLDKQTPVQERRQWFDPDAGGGVLYRYEAFYAPGRLPSELSPVTSPWQRHEGLTLVVDPSSLVERRAVEFQLGANYPLPTLPQAVCSVRYEDPELDYVHTDTEVLSSAKPSARVEFWRRTSGSKAAAYELHFPGRSDLDETGSTPSDLVLVTDPRPNVVDVMAAVAGDRADVETVIVDLRYTDLAHGVRQAGRLVFGEDSLTLPQEWSFAPHDPDRRRYWWSQTVVLKDDLDPLVTGWVEEDRPTLAVGKRYAKRWEIRPEVVGPSFASLGVERLRLKLRYQANGGPANERIVDFRDVGRGETWRLDLDDPSAREYTYEASYRLMSGFERRIGPFAGDATFLQLPSTPPA
jgi:hypothetical protein